VTEELKTREDVRKWLKVILDQGLITESQNEAWGLINTLIDMEHEAMCSDCEWYHNCDDCEERMPDEPMRNEGYY